MKVALLTAALSLSVATAGAAQTSRRDGTALAPAAPDRVAEAYEQFLLGHRHGAANDTTAAITAYKRAMELDPTAAEIPAELAALYLRQDRVQEAMITAEQALKIAPANREANRVLGVVYGAMADAEGDTTASARNAPNAGQNLAKAIRHLEIVVDRPVGDPDPNVLATLARLYLRARSYDRAISLLTDLVAHETLWQEGPLLLVDAYVGAGRNKDAITFLEQYVPSAPRLLSTLADMYERERRWKDAAKTYAQSVERAPRNTDLKSRYASALLNAGGRDDISKARDVLRDVVSTRGNDARALYLLSQSERRLGDAEAAETIARRLIALQNGRSPWGFYALAEALEERRDYKAVVDTLTPVIASYREQPGDHSFEFGLLLPHLGFGHQELGEYDTAIALLDEAHRVAPMDPAVTGYLIEAYLAAKKYGAAIELGRQARQSRPDDLRFARLEAQALRQDGKADQGIAVLEETVKRRADDPAAYVALAQLYSATARGAQAARLLRDAEAKFPADTSILFELGAVFEKQKKFDQAEAAFRQVLVREPDNAAALNYLGYMLAERGERLDESVSYLRRAVQMEPNNGAFLDSLGWAYFKSDKLDLAEEPLRRAADQLKTNSVVQDHYGALLFRLGRYAEAIAAWARALAGDGDSVDLVEIDKQIRTATQKLDRK